MKLEPDQVILFQGDSITDCSRIREYEEQPNSVEGLGGGYAGRIAGELLEENPAMGLKIFNRGIGGHRVVDLYARWKKDGLNLNPGLISILVGVNDIWHEFNQNGVELARFEQLYRMMLEDTRKRLPCVQLVLCEPFVLQCGVITPEWDKDILGRQDVVTRMAAEFDATLVPFQQMFNAALNEAPPEYWVPDGVHPSPAGHQLMARFWRKCVGV